MEVMLTAKDVAQRLRISVRTAQRWMKMVPYANVSLGQKYESLRITEESYRKLESIISSDPNIFPTRQMYYARQRQKSAKIKKIPRR